MLIGCAVVPPFLPETPAVSSTAAEKSNCLFPCLSRTDVNAWCAFDVQMTACYAERLPHIRGGTAVERCGRNPPDANNVLVRVGRLMTKSFVFSNCECCQMSLYSHVARNEFAPTMALLEKTCYSW